eukprot:COSAG04_NODE_8161_length_1013_cov_1.227571_1_plen_42_part_10
MTTRRRKSLSICAAIAVWLMRVALLVQGCVGQQGYPNCTEYR